MTTPEMVTVTLLFLLRRSEAQDLLSLFPQGVMPYNLYGIAPKKLGANLYGQMQHLRYFQSAGFRNGKLKANASLFDATEFRIVPDPPGKKFHSRDPELPPTEHRKRAEGQWFFDLQRQLPIEETPDDAPVPDELPLGASADLVEAYAALRRELKTREADVERHQTELHAAEIALAQSKEATQKTRRAMRALIDATAS